MTDQPATSISIIVRHALGGLLLALLGACGSPDSVPPEPLLQKKLAGIVKPLSLASSQNGATYRLSVYQPADYNSTSDRLPVIYLLDGGPDNGLFDNMVLIAEGLGVRAVVVGIGGFARRATDFRQPGLVPYYGFLTKELMPMVEAQYRIAPEQRTLAGHSYAGYFAASAMLIDRTGGHTFTNFIVMDMATHEQGAPLADLESAMFAATGGRLPDTTLILSGDTFGNQRDVDGFDTMMSSRGYVGLVKQKLPTTSYGHVEMINPAFKESLRLVFNK